MKALAHSCLHVHICWLFLWRPLLVGICYLSPFSFFSVFLLNTHHLPGRWILAAIEHLFVNLKSLVKNLLNIAYELIVGFLAKYTLKLLWSCFGCMFKFWGRSIDNLCCNLWGLWNLLFYLCLSNLARVCGFHLKLDWINVLKSWCCLTVQ